MSLLVGSILTLKIQQLGKSGRACQIAGIERDPKPAIIRLVRLPDDNQAQAGSSRCHADGGLNVLDRADHANHINHTLEHACTHRASGL